MITHVKKKNQNYTTRIFQKNFRLQHTVNRGGTFYRKYGEA